MKRFLLILLLFLGARSIATSHGQRTHREIVREAYKLLTLQLGRPIPVMDNYIGSSDNDGLYTGDNHPLGFQEGSLSAGTYTEDVTDPIYHNWGPGGGFVSTSHFWDADQGRNSEVLLKWSNGDAVDATIFIKDYNRANAWQKMETYQNGEFTIAYYDKANNKGYTFYYNSLVDFFVNGNIRLLKTWQGCSTSTGFLGTGSLSTDAFENNRDYFITHLCNVYTSNTNTTIESALNTSSLEHRYKITFNILGRMAHLIGDMSVPAHVHNDQHGCPEDHYENAMQLDLTISNSEKKGTEISGEQNGIEFHSPWNAHSTLRLNGGFINTYDYCSQTEPLYLLMYTTNQIADYFASYFTDGDNFYKENIGEVAAHFNERCTATPPTFWTYRANSYEQENTCAPWGWVISIFKGKCDCPYPDSDTIPLLSIRDNTYPYAIRATAGLFYWFANETGLLDNCTSGTVRLGHVHLNWLKYYFESQNIIAGKNADPDPEIVGDVIIDGDNTEVIMQASEKITLNTGLHASASNKVALHCFIAPCDNRSCSSGNTTLHSGEINSNKIATGRSDQLIRVTVNDSPIENSHSIDFSNILFLHPNPATDQIHIQYILRQPEIPSIGIYSTDGKLIQEIVTNQAYDIGIYELDVNVRSLPQGTYFCTLEYSKYSQSIKFVVQR